MPTTDVIHTLRKTRSPIPSLRLPRRSGIYAIYLKEGSSLEGINIEHDKPIYIGSTSNLAERALEHHLNSDSTGFSTVRRTIGAMMKSEFQLRAIPRRSGPANSNFVNYKFFPAGENLLTRWMQENIEIGFCPIFELDDCKIIEKELIKTFHPALNLTGWKNTYRPRIELLRKACADEARNYAG